MQSTLGHQAYQRLRQMLLQGELTPGMQLNNRRLSEAVSMSMTPVREAVARLASDGLVDLIPGAGAFVRKLSRQDVAQLYDLRDVLEPFAAAEAASHLTAHELDELTAICRDWRDIIAAMEANEQLCANAAQFARWLDNERRFHELIYKGSRNAWLSKMIGDMHLLVFAFTAQRDKPEFLTLANAQMTQRGHVRLLKALKARDAARVKKIVHRHIRVGRQRVIDFLDQTLFASEPSPDAYMANGTAKG